MNKIAIIDNNNNFMYTTCGMITCGKNVSKILIIGVNNHV